MSFVHGRIVYHYFHIHRFRVCIPRQYVVTRMISTVLACDNGMAMRLNTQTHRWKRVSNKNSRLPLAYPPISPHPETKSLHLLFRQNGGVIHRFRLIHGDIHERRLPRGHRDMQSPFPTFSIYSLPQPLPWEQNQCFHSLNMLSGKGVLSDA